MRRGVLALLCVASVGCDRLLGLTHVSEADSGTDTGTACPYNQLDPGGDADGDGVLNGADTCPLTMSTDMADEDTDGAPNVCDLCPQFVAPGIDADCDGIGVACDPDDAVTDRMEFYGFESAQGLGLTDVTLSGGAAHIVLSSTNTFSSAMTLLSVAPTGTFETTFTVHDNDITYAALSLALRTGSGTVLARFELAWTGSSWQLNLISGNTVTLQSVRLTAPASNVQFRLRGTIAGTTMRAVVTGSGEGTAEATLSTALTDVTQWGLFAYRDPANSTLNVDSDYMMLIQPL